MKKIILAFSFIFLSIINCSALADTTKTITFATEATYPPFEYIAVSGKIKGFDIDIAQALCQQMQATCEFKNQPFDSLIPSLKLGKFDAIIGALAITDARKQQVNFTTPYYKPSASFAAETSRSFPLTQAGMKGKIIGVQGGSTFEQYLKKNYAHTVQIKTYASIQDAFLDLGAARTDAVLGDTPTIDDWVKEHGKNKFTLLGKPIFDDQYFGSGYGIAVSKDNAQLLDALNKAFVKIKANGTYNNIIKKYFTGSHS